MVKQHRTLDTSDSEAPGRQSSPINLGKMMVFNPQGIENTISDGITRSSNPMALKAKATEQGIINNLNATAI